MLCIRSQLRVCTTGTFINAELDKLLLLLPETLCRTRYGYFDFWKQDCHFFHNLFLQIRDPNPFYKSCIIPCFSLQLRRHGSNIQLPELSVCKETSVPNTFLMDSMCNIYDDYLKKPIQFCCLLLGNLSSTIS